MITIEEIAKTVGGNIAGCNSLHQNENQQINEETEIQTFSTDTRTIKKGDFYIPLKGEKFDGEKFIDKAVEAGAVGYFYTDEKNVPPDTNAIGIKVADTKEAYLKLANWYRKQINPKVIMITGSSGKTTTKELVYAVVSQKYKTVKTPLNHNNEIGFCQTVFSMPKDTQVLIIEAGMRGLGEIELISRYAEPDISIITNVGTAHIGRLGSRENIAKAKCEITSHQNPDGILIAHNDELIKKTVDYKGKILYFTLADAQITKREIGHTEFTYANQDYILNTEGDYNVENSLSAINTGKYLDIDYALIKKGLAEYKPIEKRWETEDIAGYKVINDSYNANPESMRAALDTILELYPDTVVVLGDMGELGKDEEKYHREIGDFINKKGETNITVLTVGKLAKHISEEIKVCPTHSFESNKDVALYILANIKKGTTIFLKASRSMKFEEILTYLKGENK